jgi:hypothetical protein
MAECTYRTGGTRCQAPATHYVVTTRDQPHRWDIRSGPLLVRAGAGVRVWRDGLEEFCYSHASAVHQRLTARRKHGQPDCATP